MSKSGKWILYDEGGSVRQWYVDTFDENGSIVTHTMCTPGGEERLMNSRAYDYDENGRPVECRYLNSRGAVISRFTYRYGLDSAGRVIEYEEDDLDGSMLVEWYRYQYDGQGRLTERRQLDAGERCVIREEYEYDADGHLLREWIYASSGELEVVLENLWGQGREVGG